MRKNYDFLSAITAFDQASQVLPLGRELVGASRDELSQLQSRAHGLSMASTVHLGVTALIDSGSYGAVVELSRHLQPFPLLRHYMLSGLEEGIAAKADTHRGARSFEIGLVKLATGLDHDREALCKLKAVLAANHIALRTEACTTEDAEKFQLVVIQDHAKGDVSAFVVYGQKAEIELLENLHQKFATMKHVAYTAAARMTGAAIVGARLG